MSAKLGHWASQNDYDYCPCHNDAPDPCPACGATVEPQDRWPYGCCQLPSRPHDYGLRIILVDKHTGKPI